MVPAMTNAVSDAPADAGSRRIAWANWGALLVAVLAGCSDTERATTRETVTVLAAASTTDAIHQIARRFQQAHPGIRVDVSTGPSNGLAQQILAGAPADVFLSANQKWSDAIAQQGLAGRRVELLTNRMVLIVPQGNPAKVTDPSDLNSAEIQRVAIAGENVPAGIYAQQALQNLNLFESLRRSNKLARGSDVRITLAYVQRGEAEAGIVYATDARISQQAEVVASLDPQTYDRVVYPAVLLQDAAEREAAHRFFQFLQSQEARDIFGQFGFTPLSE
jgi:molybdate transport system substrate-binding protein